MRNSSTACPKNVKYAPVFTSDSPVTQVAEVAVKSAVRKGVVSPVLDDTGSMISSVPTNISTAKPSAMRLAVFILFRNRIVLSILIPPFLHQVFFHIYGENKISIG